MHLGVEGVVTVDAAEIVVPIVGDVVWRWQARCRPWGRWRHRVRPSYRQWAAGSSFLLPEYFQRFPRGLRLASGLRG